MKNLNKLALLFTLAVSMKALSAPQNYYMSVFGAPGEPNMKVFMVGCPGSSPSNGSKAMKVDIYTFVDGK